MIDLDALIAQAHGLEPLPSTVLRLAGLIASQDYEVDDVAEIVAFDQALTLKLLRAANSASNMGVVAVTTVKEAVARLGASQILAFSIASQVGPLLQTRLPQYGLTEGKLWRHSVAAAVSAEVAPKYLTVPAPPESFTAALLHDIGKLVMAQFLKPEILSLLWEAKTLGGLTALAAETELLRVHHAELGGLIAKHWELPENIVKGIHHHHTPELGCDPICDLVHVANIAAKRTEAALDRRNLKLWPKADAMERLGLSPDKWEDLCTASVARFEQVKASWNLN